MAVFLLAKKSVRLHKGVGAEGGIVMNLNQITIIANLTRDPETRETQTGMKRTTAEAVRMLANHLGISRYMTEDEKLIGRQRREARRQAGIKKDYPCWQAGRKRQN